MKQSKTRSGAVVDDELATLLLYSMAHLANSMGGSISFYSKDLESVGKVDLIIERTDDGVPKCTFSTQPRHPYSSDD